MGFFSQAFLDFLMKESKMRRRKQPGKLKAKSRSQLVNLPGAQPLMNPLSVGRSSSKNSEIKTLHCKITMFWMPEKFTAKAS